MVKLKSAHRPRRNHTEVLVIDDEPRVRSVLAEALAANGYLLAGGTSPA